MASLLFSGRFKWWKSKSIFFENNIYKVGQELNVVSYNGRKYVLLESET